MQLEINNRGQVAMIREDGANKRKLMDVTARALNTETINEASKPNQRQGGRSKQIGTGCHRAIDVVNMDTTTD